MAHEHVEELPLLGRAGCLHRHGAESAEDTGHIEVPIDGRRVGVSADLAEDLEDVGPSSAAVESIPASVKQDADRRARETQPTTPQNLEDAPSNSVLIRLDTVKAEKVSWLWPGRIPYGKLTILDGDPGMGKSAVSIDIAARVTVGDSMPGETIGREPAGVVILTAEDGLGDTVKPRVEVAGGDPSRIVVLDAVRLAGGAHRMPTLADVENLREAIADVDAKFVIVDPIMAYLGTKDGHKDQDIRSLLHPLAHLAGETGVAGLLIRHLTKGEKANPIYRGGGSIGIGGAARSVLLVAPDREDPELRVLASVKSNLSAPPPSLSYRLVPENDVVRVVWQGTVDVTAAALLAAQGMDEEVGGRLGAEAFLRGLLAEGPIPSKSVVAQAREAGISEITLKRAKASLGVKARKTGGTFGGDPGWCWELPGSPEDNHHDPLQEGTAPARPDPRPGSPEGDHPPLKEITDQHDPLQARVIPFSEEARRGGTPPATPDPKICRQGYAVGDRLPHGQVVLEVDDHGPLVLSKHRSPPPGRTQEPGEDTE